MVGRRILWQVARVSESQEMIQKWIFWFSFCFKYYRPGDFEIAITHRPKKGPTTADFSLDKGPGKWFPNWTENFYMIPALEQMNTADKYCGPHLTRACSTEWGAKPTFISQLLNWVYKKVKRAAEYHPPNGNEDPLRFQWRLHGSLDFHTCQQ